MDLCRPYAPLGLWLSWFKGLAAGTSVDAAELERLWRSSPQTSSASSPIWLAGLDITLEISNISTHPCRRGGMADVYDADWITSRRKQRVAVKVVRALDTSGLNLLSPRLLQEIEVWKQLRHTNILPFCGLYTGPLWKLPALVSPWCRNGDVNSYLKSAESRGCAVMKSMKLDLIAQIFAGIEYLHTRTPKIVHADIKGANVLISDHGVARLSDFGFASALAEDHVYSTQHSVCGTWRWMAPELHDLHGGHTTYSDIWAAGCLLIEIQSGTVPYHTTQVETAVILAQSRHELPPRPPNMSDEIWELVMQCCTINPFQRPRISDLVRTVHVMRSLDKTLRGDDDQLRRAYDATLRAITEAKANRRIYGSVRGEVDNFHIWVPAMLTALRRLVNLRPIVQDVVLNLECSVLLELRRDRPCTQARLALMAVMMVGEELLDIITSEGAAAVDDSFNDSLQSLMEQTSMQIEDCSSSCEAYAQLPYLSRLFARQQWNQQFERCTQALAARRHDIAQIFGRGTLDYTRQVEIIQHIYTATTPAEYELVHFVEQNGGISELLGTEAECPPSLPTWCIDSHDLDCSRRSMRFHTKSSRSLGLRTSSLESSFRGRMPTEYGRHLSGWTWSS